VVERGTDKSQAVASSAIIVTTGGLYETAGFHHSSWYRRYRLAARGSRSNSAGRSIFYYKYGHCHFLGMVR
jgi:hypothetical protein